MRYPNSRYGNPEELKYYSQGMPIKALAKKLKRSEKSVKQWLSLEKKVPYWVPELLRLWHMEKDLIMRQMGFGEQKLRFGLIEGEVIQFPRSRSTDNRESALLTASALPIPTEPAMECSWLIKREATR